MKKSKQLTIYFKQFFGFFLALIWLIPFYLILTNSFKEKREIFENPLGIPHDATFANYPEAFKELEFVKTLANSLLITVISVLVIILFSSIAAYALERNTNKKSTFVFMLFVAAMLVPFQAVMIPLVSLFGHAELLNRFGLIVMNSGFGTSLSIFLYHGSLKSIPKALDEAALIDGANRIQIFFRVIFPQLKSTTVTVAVLNSLGIWNDYLLPSLVINAPDTRTLPLKMYFFFGEYARDWNLALAGLALALLPIILFYFFMQKHIINGVSQGAVK